MTEAEWLACNDPTPMLRFLLASKASVRKLRLFACSWFGDKTHWARVADIVAIGERYADGMALQEEVENARSRAIQAGSKQVVWVTVCDGIVGRLMPVFSHEFVALGSDLKGYVHRLRDIFGNPFRPVTLDPRWRSETVVALAQGIYAEHAFDRMPILADALEEAGCDHADVLTHCRDPNAAHVRGCWVVDGVLGRV